MKNILDIFVTSYIKTALWSSIDGEGVPLDDSKYADSKLAPATLRRIKMDCARFIVRGRKLFGEYFTGPQVARTAHNFWLTRNHHGAGFWDGDYPENVGEKLTDLAHSFGECDLYIGDDGKIYC